NHYSTLRTIEAIFGLPYLGYAGAPGLAVMGNDIFSR
ncbi:MAG: phosphoesterase, partial [Candidatus Eremiobacteraeota bacterium]|nr:phosphoesterase [Candidatus Eremiobacteraeota bacterium]